MIVPNLAKRDFLRPTNQWIPTIQEYVSQHNLGMLVPVSALFEREVMALQSTGEDWEEYQLANPAHKSALNDLVQACYSTLNLIRFYTASSTEVNVWSVKEGILAPQAAGVVHTDYERFVLGSM